MMQIRPVRRGKKKNRAEEDARRMREQANYHRQMPETTSDSLSISEKREMERKSTAAERDSMKRHE